MRRRATKQQIALTIGLLTVLVAAGYWWAPHIWWSFVLARNAAKVPSVPVSALEAPGQTSDWFTCLIGPLSCKLPPELAEDAERSVAKKNFNSISLKTASLELLIFVPFKAPAGAQTDLVQIAARLNRSPVELIADAYRSSTDDFRWTMSHAELHHHQTLLKLGLMYYPHVAGMKVESQFDAPLEGLLVVHDPTRAVFEWQAKSGVAAGFVGFTCTSGNLNLDHVRDICASVTLDEAKLGPELTKSELAELVDTIEISKD